MGKTPFISLQVNAWIFWTKHLLVAAIVSFSIYKLIQIDNFFDLHISFIYQNLLTFKGLLFVFAILLSIPNWLFEVYKWHIASNLIENASFSKSFTAVLSGQAINFIFPASIGHYLGRVLNIDINKNSRSKAVSLVFACQASQMLITFICSIAGLVYLKQVINVPSSLILIVFGAISCIIIIICVLKATNNKYIFLVRRQLSIVKSPILFQILTFSFLRYLVFTAQYVLILKFLGTDVGILPLTMAITIVFMAKSIMPSIHFLSDLGVREFSALLVLPLLGITNSVIIGGSLYLWIINILIPSLIGAYLLFHSKWNLRFS